MFGWLKDHWKAVVTVAASIAVGVAVTALVIATAPVSVPALLVTGGALAAGGFAGGVTGYYLGHWLEGRPMTLGGALREGTIGAVVSVATFGLGRAIAPAISRVVAPVVSRVVPETAVPLVTRATTSGISFGTAGAVTGAGQQVTTNIIDGRPVTENVLQAAGTNALFAGTLSVAGEVVVSRLRPTRATVEPPKLNPPEMQQPLLDAQTQPGQRHLYYQDRIFKDYAGPGSDNIPAEGWKLHVSATPENAGDVANLVLPELRAMGVPHKVVGTVADFTNVMRGTQTGKFITIYPESPAQARLIVDRLDAVLRDRGLRGLTVPEERPLGDSGLIFTRYGGFTKSTVTGPNGYEVPDVRGQIAPPWIQDPFAPPTNTNTGGGPARTRGMTGALGGNN